LINGNVTWVTGVNGKCLDFNGGFSDKVIVPNANSLAFRRGWSASVWVKYKISNSDQKILYWSNGSTEQFVFHFTGSANSVTKVSFDILYAGYLTQYRTNETITPGEWHHLVVVASDEYNVEIYIDGVASTTTHFNPGIYPTTDNRLFIGGWPVGDSKFPFDGLIDEVYIFSYALTTFQVDSLYNLNNNNLIAHWDFNEGSGDTLFDNSGNGHHGVINGALWEMGIEGQALNFDGNNDYVQLQMPIIETAPFTICAWVNPDNININSNKYIATNGGETVNSFGYYLYLTRGTDDPRWGFGIRYSNGDCKTAYAPSNLNQYSFVCGICDNVSENPRITVNGVEVFQADTCLSGVGPIRNMRIGSESASTLDSWDGSIDEMSLYNQALSISEIALMWDQFKPTSPKLIPVISPTLNLRPQFTWHTFDTTKTYTIQINNNSDFTSPLFTIPVLDPSYTSLADLPIGTIYWHVKSDIYNIYSETDSFVIQPDSIPFLIRFRGLTISELRPAFIWNTVPGASTYRIEIDTSSQFTSPLLGVVVSDTSFTPLADLALGTYFWRISSNLNFSLFSTPDDLAISNILAIWVNEPTLEHKIGLTNPAKYLSVNFNLIKSDIINISIISLHGVTINIKRNEQYAAGAHTIRLDEKLNPGIYILNITGKIISASKIILIRP